MAVRAALCVIAHLCRAVDSAFVCALAPPVSAIHGRILDILVPAGMRCAFGVELVAHLGHCLNDMAGVWRCGATQEEVMVLLAVVCFERRKLWAVLKLGAHSERCRGEEPGKGEGPCDHCEGD